MDQPVTLPSSYQSVCPIQTLWSRAIYHRTHPPPSSHCSVDDCLSKSNSLRPSPAFPALPRPRRKPSSPACLPWPPSSLPTQLPLVSQILQHHHLHPHRLPLDPTSNANPLNRSFSPPPRSRPLLLPLDRPHLQALLPLPP